MFPLSFEKIPRHLFLSLLFGTYDRLKINTNSRTVVVEVRCANSCDLVQPRAEFLLAQLLSKIY